MPSRLRFTITALFHFLLLATPFVFTWVNEELFEFNKMLFVYGVTIMIVGAWIMRMFSEKRLVIRRTSLDLPIFLFLASQILSTLFSIHPRTSVFGYYTRFNGGLLSTFTYIALFYAFVSNIDRKQIKSLLISLLLGGFFISLYAIPEHFGHSASCLMITGKFDVNCWVQKVQDRVFASFGQPNWLAAYTITLIPLALAFSITQKARKIKIFLLSTLTALFITTIFTKSRSGQLGLGAGLGVFLLGSRFVFDNTKEAVVKLKTPIIIFILVSIIFGTTITPSINEVWQKNTPKSTTNSNQITNLPDSQITPMGGTDSGEIRKIVWEGAINVWKRYPLFGSGVETFAYSYYLDRPMAHNLVSEWDFLYNKAHNEFLNLLATTGVVGLGTYMFFLGSYLWKTLQTIFPKSKLAKETKLLSLGMASGIVALSISNFFGFSTVMVSVLLFLFPAILIILTEENNEIQEKTDEKFSFFNYLGMIATVFLVFFSLSATFRIWQADKIFSQGKSLIASNNYIDGATKIQEAIGYSPKEALFYDELASVYSKLAISYAQAEEATTSTQLAQAALQTSKFTLQLNDRHLNFYKTQARIYINLSQLEQSLLDNAKETLHQALDLAPTDAKLMYNLGLVELSQRNSDEGTATLLKAVKMKPNYLAARLELAKQYEKENKVEKAQEQYRYLLDNVVPGDVEIMSKLVQ